VKTHKTPLRLFIFILFVGVLTAKAQASVSMKDSVEAAIEKQKNVGANSDILEISSRSLGTWVDGTPIVSASYLKSQDNLGVDELELSLQVPIKSSFRRNLDKELNQNLSQIQKANQQLYRLSITGLLRDIVWDYQIQQTQIAAIQKKWDVVSGLEAKFKMMTASRVLPEYLALLLEKESVDNQILLLEHKHKSSLLYSQYKQLTGLSEMPAVYVEQNISDSSSILLQHPQLLAIEASWKINLNKIKNANNDAEPWHLQVTAKKLDSLVLSENQVGLGISVPFSIGSSYSSAQQSEYLQLRSEFELNKQTLLTSLERNFSQSIHTLNFLQQKQSLLDRNKALLRKLDISITTLLEANVENKEALIRNALDVIDAESSIELNQIIINKQLAIVRQSAGLTL
jgi:hypothetical protein